MADDSFFLIDIERILKEKLGSKYKYVPGFLVSYLKRIVHQDELNVFLRESKDQVGVDFLEACMEFLDCKVEVKGLENLPENGRCTFVCNHQVSSHAFQIGFLRNAPLAVEPRCSLIHQLQFFPQSNVLIFFHLYKLPF